MVNSGLKEVIANHDKTQVAVHNMQLYAHCFQGQIQICHRCVLSSKGAYINACPSD